MSERVDTFTVCQPGIEEITRTEVARLGVQARVTHGGVIGSMTWTQLALAQLQLRTATRVLVRVARFDAEHFGALDAGLRRVEWHRWLPHDADVQVRVSTSASRFYHSGAVEERVREVVPSGAGEPQLLTVRIDRDLVTLSLDASGEPLYRRGWRTEAVGAPMRETLAAALVLWSGWDGKTPLVDPCCGSGTIAVEAALWARRVAPGHARSFALEHWPVARGVDWGALRAAAEADVRTKAPVVVAADVDADAVAMTGRNADRAGVSVHTEVSDAADLARGTRAGWVVTNPPYGQRLGGDLRHVYASVGRLGAAPWHLAVAAPLGAPTSAFGARWADQLATRNGGLPIRFLRT